MSSEAPVLLEIKSQVGRHNLAATIAHEARSTQLSHECIDNRHASLARLPSSDQIGVAPPRKSVVTFRADSLLPKDSSLVGLTVEAEELAPAQFKVKVSRRLVLCNVLLKLQNVVVKFADREAAVCEPRRELGGIVCTNHSISGLFVLLEALLIEKVVGDSLQSCRLSASELKTCSLIFGCFNLLFNKAKVMNKVWQVFSCVSLNIRLDL